MGVFPLSRFLTNRKVVSQRSRYGFVLNVKRSFWEILWFKEGFAAGGNGVGLTVNRAPKHATNKVRVRLRHRVNMLLTGRTGRTQRRMNTYNLTDTGGRNTPLRVLRVFSHTTNFLARARSTVTVTRGRVSNFNRLNPPPTSIGRKCVRLPLRILRLGARN